jgi:hypothetical protein
MNPADSRPEPPDGYAFPPGVGQAHSVGSPRFLVVPSTRAVPYHPGEPDRCSYPLLPCRLQASPSLAGWPLSSTLFEAETGSCAYGSRLRHCEASHPRLLRACARKASCRMGNSHGKLLSACGNNQTCPGAPMQCNEDDPIPLAALPAPWPCESPGEGSRCSNGLPLEHRGMTS